MRYRRADTPGAIYVFTPNAADRSGRLLTDHIDALRDSMRTVRRSRPFVLDAICVLPDHLHLLMTLPREDADFAARLMLIKQGFSRRVPSGERIGVSRASKGERGLWQPRYWEHLSATTRISRGMWTTSTSIRSSVLGAAGSGQRTGRTPAFIA